MSARRKPADAPRPSAARPSAARPSAPRPSAARPSASRPSASRPSASRLKGEPSAEERVASMVACVRSSGLKLTPQRLAIVRELAADPTHPTAQELFERLRPALPTMSFATVYNTLDALASAGLCAALSLSPGPSRFDPNMKAHHHAVCDRCGLVRDIHLDAAKPRASEPERTPSEIAEIPGFVMRSVERIYRGLCADCARDPRASRDPGASRGRRGGASPPSVQRA